MLLLRCRTLLSKRNNRRSCMPLLAQWQGLLCLGESFEYVRCAINGLIVSSSSLSYDICWCCPFFNVVALQLQPVFVYRQIKIDSALLLWKSKWSWAWWGPHMENFNFPCSEFIGAHSQASIVKNCDIIHRLYDAALSSVALSEQRIVFVCALLQSQEKVWIN